MTGAAAPLTGAAAREGRSALRVGGLTPFTAIDYPGQLAAVVFVQGCPWRCLPCHNPHLQPREVPAGAPDWAAVHRFLQQRVGLIDAVVFSGGEPTIDAALPSAMRQVRQLGFKVGLHTAGVYPRRLREVLPLVDWVGLDVKAPLGSAARHDAITGVRHSSRAAHDAVDCVLASGVDAEFRTTAHPALLSEAEVLALAEDIARRGVRRYALQVFRPEGCVSPGLGPVRRDYPSARTLGLLGGLFEHFTLRRDA